VLGQLLEPVEPQRPDPGGHYDPVLPVKGNEIYWGPLVFVRDTIA